MSDQREDGGQLGSRAAQEAGRQIEAALRRRQRQNIETLLRTPAFVEWLAGHAEPYLLGDRRDANVADLQRFMGERSLMLRQLRDFAAAAPGFIERLLTSRRVVLEESQNAAKPRDEEPHAD